MLQPVTEAEMESREAPGLQIINVKRLNLADIQCLLLESRAQGFRFLDRLYASYESGENRFDKVGEGLYGIRDQYGFAAIGGLNIDPYLSDPAIGRVKHVYVKESLRRSGIGRMIMNAIISQARTRFELLTLRTDSEAASAFYRSLGFQNEPTYESSTHYLRLAEISVADHPD